MDEIKALQGVFGTLSDYNRLRIIHCIRDKECSVGEIVKATQLSQPLVSHHLKVMKKYDLLGTMRNGLYIFYYIKSEKLLYAINLFYEIMKDSGLVDSNATGTFCPDWILKKYKQKE
jgi:DNA-binding transcriptional ArsR family regulator